MTRERRRRRTRSFVVEVTVAGRGTTLAEPFRMSLAEKYETMGRLSRASVGGMTFDVETDAQHNDPPQVRTYVFLDGRIVDRVVWDFQDDDAQASARLVRLQHEGVMKQIHTRMAGGMPEEDSRVIGTLPPPKLQGVESGDEAHLLESSRPVVPTDLAVTSMAVPTRLPHAHPLGILSPSVSVVSCVQPALGVPFTDGAVIDDDASVVFEVGASAGTMADVAFLAAGLDALVGRHLALGPCEHIALQMSPRTVLVVRGGDLTAAFYLDRKGSTTRIVAEVRRALDRLAEEGRS